MGGCLFYGIYIELASRHYPFGMVGVMEAIFASYLICLICKKFEFNKCIKMMFSFIGANTLTMFEIHALDWYVKSFWDTADWKVASLKRVCIVLLVAALLLAGKHIWKRFQGKRS